jgi:DNA-binding transcriptional ArsR family regulator
MDAERLFSLRSAPAHGEPFDRLPRNGRFRAEPGSITKHLRVLSGAGLVRGSRRGREQIWELEPKRLADAHAYLDRISMQWDEALDRLKRLIEVRS